mmetsp:Transcript_99014/g.295779  ORF Transcript_99014/g.295779 Transcript_99014/m.295779 type:complete len:220 (-) Transcript_99014:33-692(-)
MGLARPCGRHAMEGAWRRRRYTSWLRAQGGDDQCVAGCLRRPSSRSPPWRPWRRPAPPPRQRSAGGPCRCWRPAFWAAAGLQQHRRQCCRSGAELEAAATACPAACKARWRGPACWGPWCLPGCGRSSPPTASSPCSTRSGSRRRQARAWPEVPATSRCRLRCPRRCWWRRTTQAQRCRAAWPRPEPAQRPWRGAADRRAGRGAGSRRGRFDSPDPALS